MPAYKFEALDAAGKSSNGLIDAEIGQPRDGARRVVRVQRGEHQVAGERGLDRDLRGLVVADLADHDHVRVLAQDGAQRLGEGEVDLRVHLRLADAGQLVLDRVLHRQHVGGGGIDAGHRRVQRRRLARAGGAGDEHDAVGFADQFVHARERRVVHAQPRPVVPAGMFIEQSQHHALAMPGGYR